MFSETVQASSLSEPLWIGDDICPRDASVDLSWEKQELGSLLRNVAFVSSMNNPAIKWYFNHYPLILLYFVQNLLFQYKEWENTENFQLQFIWETSCPMLMESSFHYKASILWGTPSLAYFPKNFRLQHPLTGILCFDFLSASIFIGLEIYSAVIVMLHRKIKAQIFLLIVNNRGFCAPLPTFSISAKEL